MSQVRFSSDGLKERLGQLIPEKQNEVKEFRAKFGENKVGEVTVNMVCGRGRG